MLLQVEDRRRWRGQELHHPGGYGIWLGVCPSLGLLVHDTHAHTFAWYAAMYIFQASNGQAFSLVWCVRVCRGHSQHFHGPLTSWRQEVNGYCTNQPGNPHAQPPSLLDFSNMSFSKCLPRWPVAILSPLLPLSLCLSPSVSILCVHPFLSASSLFQSKQCLSLSTIKDSSLCSIPCLEACHCWPAPQYAQWPRGPTMAHFNLNFPQNEWEPTPVHAACLLIGPS